MSLIDADKYALVVDKYLFCAFFYGFYCREAKQIMEISLFVKNKNVKEGM